MASSQFPVAVIGIGVRLPGAKNCEEFWKLMIDGKDTVDEFPKERADDIDHVLSSFRGQLVDEDKPFFTGSFFKSVDQFDPDLFQINPRESLFIEPEQRFFLEVVWELLEDAGYASKIKGTNTGVYVGNTVNKYKYILNENHPSISHGNHSPFISSRVSYTHDLHGPAMMVATGCSSSLLAVHLACQGLLSGDCEMAVAGGITLDLLPISVKTDIWNQLGITGPHVKCRAFDASAKGIAKGEGCGVVLLKPLKKAIADGDHIYGILEATTANQDGHSNGITAPHPVAQAKMLHQAWKLAGITPDSLGFFEAHGTGTELGDPIEISGITNAFKMSGVKIPQEADRKIPIGSVKANIGHLADGAAGIVGLIKSLLCLHHSRIPGAINFTNPNPHINWKKSPVAVNAETKEWSPSHKAPRYASVSAFGLLGTNIHAVVKEYQPPTQSPSTLLRDQKEVHCLCLAANTAKSLEAYSHKLLSYLRQCHDTSNQMVRNICYSINTGREQSRFKHRAVISAHNMEELIEALGQLNNILIHGTTDIICAANIAVNLNGNTHCSSTTINESHSTAKKLMIQNFINGKSINWNDIYQDKCDLHRVPQLPTYQFDRVRLWPKIETPINRELLQLEHKFVGRTDYHSFLADHKDYTTGNSGSSTEKVTDLLVNSLSEALNMTFDWEQRGDENLFELGMDSLIFSLIAMKIKSEMGIDLSMGEFHKTPTFNGLLSTIIASPEEEKRPNKGKEKLISNTKKLEVADIKTILCNALNEALGQDIDWNTHIEENLFSLGVDSLIYTHVNMKLKEATNIETPISMAELHENPTFSSLHSILNSKLSQDEERVTNIQITENKKHDGELYPISFAQRRLWVMEEMVDNACTYNATNCLKIMGDFHPNAFRQALYHVFENNATFNTIFVDDPNGPLQKYDQTLNLDLKMVDLKELNDKAEDVAKEHYSTDYKTPFDLYEGPLVRCTLYILPSNAFYFTMVVHHIIFDGWSHFVFYNELWSTYRDLIEGHGAKTLKSKMSYADIAVAEHMNSQSPTSRITKDIEYWKQKLVGDLPLITFPGDKKRPPVFTYNGKRITKFIPHEVFEKLKQCSANHHTTFMNIISSVFCLIKKYTGEEDLIIGTPIAGRHDAKSKDVIGCFINTLALRVNLEDNLNFTQVLEEVSKVCLEAYDHQQAPFDHLVSQLNLPRDTSITPVFSINVCYHNTETKGDHVNPPDELTVERKLLHNDSSKWDMQFDFLEEPEGMRFTLEFYSDLFSDEYASLIVDSYISLLNSISNCPNQPIELLHLNSPVDQISSESSVLMGPKRDLGSKTLPTLLYESIKTNHGSEIIEGNTRIKYVDLGKDVQKLASFLRLNCKLPKGSRVGLLMENTTKSIESVLSCLLSGLVYVPMDVNSPNSRLQHISVEADLKAVLFSKQYLNLANSILWSCSNIESLVCIDAEDFDALVETEQTPLMDIELWDCVAVQAEDGIEGGGWKSSYTGEHMTEEEMTEYSNNIYQKLKPFLNKSTRVLEIGSASGLTTKMIKPHVGSYVATDLSTEMIKKLKESNKDEPNMEFMCGPADEVCRHFQGRQFDVIIMNSVVHCFPGYNYLKDVIRNCEKMLSQDGIIFIGDVMDLDIKEDLVSSMKTFKADNPKHRTKTDWNNELFISKRFLQHICSSSQILKSFQHSRKLYSIPNELTEFRYDAVLSRSQNKNNEEPSSVSTYALRDIEEAEVDNLSLPIPTIRFTDEAYILYTSGTSGTPKGVIISQGALLNYVQWASRTYAFSPQTSTPFFAPLTFDFTITSILPPILKGSQIYVYKNFQDHYQDIAENRQLTIGKFSPLQLDMMLAVVKFPLSIKTFIIGGEELKSSLMTKLKENKANQDFAVWNEYGPTEATVGCVVKCFKSEDLPLKDSELVTIGHPIDNIIVGIIRNNQLVPIGGKGSLAIGGRCLCNGFAGIGMDKTTKMIKAFKNSVWSQPAERMLITDDVAEILPSTKEMAYFGRKESGVVKVNGIRVDLHEIQKALEDILFVQSAWVCCFDYGENTLLGAALVLHSTFPEKSTWQKSVLAALQNSLPLRIIPKVLIEVSKPPINKNGKTDMKFLRDQCIIKMQQSSSPEGTDVENNFSPRLVQVQRIWQSILPINFLPKPNQNFFFELSGDSLQAIHLVRKMREEGFKVTVTDIFQHPTIEKLLPVLELEVIGDQNIQQDKEGIPFKPTPILEEYILNERKYPDHFALSSLLDFHSKINADLLRKALRSVMQKHGSLRSKISKENGQVFQEVLPLKPDQPKIVEVEFESKENHLSDEQEFIEICEELDQGHSLADGIVVGAAVFHMKCSNGENKCYGLLVVHHAAIDIVSWQQILEDLAVAFRALSADANKEPVLKPCQLPFRAYCDAVHEASGGIFLSEVDYWTDVQQKSKEAGLLVQQDVQSHFKTAKWFSKSIDATSLRSTSTGLGCSDEQVLLTAFGRAMSAIHGKDKTSLCMESHGRQLDAVDSTDTVGWCTSMYPFILDTPLRDDMVEQVKKIGQDLNSITNRGLGFGLLKSAGKLTMAHPKVTFIFQGSLDASSKETLNGGDYRFDHIPWIEIMLRELQQRRFHRHEDELLEFDLEFIAWIHSGELKFGCLFDEKTISQSIVEEIVKRAEMNLSALSEKVHKKTTSTSINIIPGFNLTPECKDVIIDALSHHQIDAEYITIQPAESFMQSLYQSPSSAKTTLIIPRIQTEDQRKEIEMAMESYLVKNTGKTVILGIQNLPNTLPVSEKLATVDVTIDQSQYEPTPDAENLMPLSKFEYTNLALKMARLVRKDLQKSSYKVIAVDGDFTLWHGECAEGNVELKDGHIQFQKFLLEQKNNGMLLVLLSKNEQQDVEIVFENPPKNMVLKREDFVQICGNWDNKFKNLKKIANHLNLGLKKAFLFVDDNVLECEEMLRKIPEVLTLLYPSDQQLVTAFIDSLWLLDHSQLSQEAASRTQMYQEEFKRVEEINDESNIDGLENILRGWNMEMVLLETTVKDLKDNALVYNRSNELLHRTNQFKLNDTHTDMDAMCPDDSAYVVSLKDKHGSYGIVSVCIINNKSEILQWVVSCRALNRFIENRILKEIFDKQGRSSQAVYINKTKRNTPLINLMKTLSVVVEDGTELRKYEIKPQIPVELDLHQVNHTTTSADIGVVLPPTTYHLMSQTNFAESSQQSVLKLQDSIQTKWTPLLVDQSNRHLMFPLVPTSKFLSGPRSVQDIQSLDGVVKALWMEVLGAHIPPTSKSNFLTEGGTSFAAVFLVTKLRRLLQKNITIVDLLKNPSYEDFLNKVVSAEDDVEERMENRDSTTQSLISAAQRRMIIMQETAPESTAYTETLVSYVQYPVDAEAILKRLLKFHPILKTIIESNEKGEYRMKYDEVEQTSTKESVGTWEDVKEFIKETTPVIPVLSSPLYRFRHVTAGHRHHIILHVHHIICDDVTLMSMNRTLHNLLNGAEFRTKKSKDQYQLFLQTEAEYLKSKRFDQDEAYWRDIYSMLPPTSEMISNIGSSWNDTTTYRANQQTAVLPKEAHTMIQNICHSLQITEFQYYLSVTAIVLQQYLGTSDICLPVPISNRSFQFQHSDGLFVNTVVPRIKTNHLMTLKENIKSISEACLEVMEHSTYPLDCLTSSVWKIHGQSLSTLCIAMFNCVTTSSDAQIRIPSKHAKMPISIDVLQDKVSGETELIVEWAEDLVPSDMAQRMFKSLFEVLSSTDLTIDRRLQETSFLSKTEAQLIKTFNKHHDILHVKDVPCQSTLEAHTKEHGDKVAVVCDDVNLTYNQLNRMANAVANHILSIVEPSILKKQPVVLLMEKNENAIAAILGVWKAGGYFLPVSLSNIATLNDICERSNPALVLTSLTEDVIPGIKDDLPVIHINEITHNTSEQISFASSIDDLAYVIRTSGSTGTPKQCKIRHRSLQVMAASWEKAYRMTEFEVTILQWAPLSFDVFVGDVVRALISVAGTLVVCPDEKRLDVGYILKTIQRHKVSIMEVTPQFGQQLVENSVNGNLNSLHTLILGSDTVQAHLYKRVKSHLRADQRLLNSYGMTEATIDSSFFEGNPPETSSGTVPIGKPLPGVKYHIVNKDTLQPCPIGTAGELYIEGDVLAEGDVDLVRLPFTESVSLKTGDVARWLPTGNVELLGRLDNMMKLRGFRISTTEIENKIASTDSKIKSVCVIPLTNDAEVEFLCAFVTVYSDGGVFINKAGVSQKLRGTLPYYMIPDIVHVIDKIPLTSNGKVNRRALPNIDDLLKEGKSITSNTQDDNSSTVSILTALFSDAMGLDAGAIDQDLTFMEQGGHSLILLRFASSIKLATEYEVGIADIFSYPSIAALAKYIDERSELEAKDEPEKMYQNRSENDIAITGIGMRLPGGIESLPEFWKILVDGDDMIQEFPKQRKHDFLRCIDANKAEMYSKLDTFKGSFLDNIDQFDHQFFKIAPGEAKFMSPEQRLFLQVSTEALTESRDINHVKGSKIGVFVSNSEIGYGELDQPGDAVGISGLMPGMVATRVAYQWDLKGPTMLVDTACSSSLMALKLASESIKKGECEGALVGGANLTMYPARKGVHGDTGILSPDFHCNAFDKDATGTAVGEGVICLYIEPLRIALQNDKHIYGVLKGVASNSVGHGNGITAPTATSQQSVIEAALNMTGLKPSDLSYIETHGTGTKLGDRIELSALSNIFNAKNCVQELHLGATKTAFGHLDSAAGMIGVLKVLALNVFKEIPPMHSFRNPHPELNDSSLIIPRKQIPLSSGIFNAGVSSFGLTGTNCHAIISQGPVKVVSEDDGEPRPLILIAKNMKQLQSQMQHIVMFIEQTIIKSPINTLTGLCVQVAKQTKQLLRGKLVHADLKLVIYVKNPNQALKTLNMLMSVPNDVEVAKLASMRSDIDFGESSGNVGVQQFFAADEIDLYNLFSKEDLHHQAFGVYMDMFCPTRHWCDPSTSIRTQNKGLLEILQRKITDAREMVRSLPLAATPELKELEGRFCVAVIIKLLLTTKLEKALKENSEVTLRKSFKDTGMLPKYDKLYYVMIRELFENNVVIPTGKDRDIHCLDSFQFQCNHLLDIDPEPIARFAMEKYSAWSDCFRFPLYCSKYLTKVLWGKMSPLSVIYPQGDLNYMYQFDKLGDLIGDVYYNMYMQMIASYAKQLSSQGRKVRVLEVGAGMGHVTRQLIPKLKDTPNVEYWFTDLGKAFVENAKTLFKDYLYMMKFSTFDITKSAPKQGLLGSYDIVISYNVIHTTESVMDSVTNLKSCVGDDGTLFVIESAKNETWATLAWGILDGWWYFKDYDMRPDEPMMEPEKWERVLKGVGFGSVHSCPVDAFEREQVEKFLFVCSAKPLAGELKKEPGWWETINLTTRRHQDLEEDIARSTDTGVDEAVVGRNAVHKELKQIWCELLGLDDIQPNDDFNSLGGESLLAIQMMTLVRKRIGYQLEIADTFGYPTLAALANYIADQLDENDETVESNEQWIHISTPSSLSDIDESECGGTLLMFPGQGAQKPGMCLSMKDSSSAKALFARAETIIGYNILDICLKNNDETAENLKSTEFVQVALLVGCLAKIDQLKEENPDALHNVTHVTGLSVGEFAALVYAEVISFEDAVRVIQIRGRAMENEVKQSATGMVSVFGPNCETLSQFLANQYPNMKISTYLADNQHTVAGTADEVESLVNDLSDAHKEELGVIDARRLRVAGAFHSSYMKNASKIVDPVITSIQFSKPTTTLIMNVTGGIEHDPHVIKELLCEQLVAPVQWKQSVLTAYKAGVTNFIEVAPARVLSSIVKNRISIVKNCNCELIVV